ncbi:hypothetical protein SAMN02745148_00974 [Modicisalibacter ilicicola DSM 19980]|uniref:Uncharacterized protein n=2 Tax=Modicisalibacter ilicicola TaxID=480814 RepID=A0A1M4VV96_9GAMM|nr:hypothetical protein SAMN02745148_00974 [Halomonas ilicicola DSM 19980]
MVTPVRLQRHARRWPLVLLSFIAVEGVAAFETDDSPQHGNTRNSLSSLESLSFDELEQFRGRENVNLINVQSLQNLEATASGNSVNAGNVISGPITIESHAIDSFDGVGLFNIMTGHNNAVTSAVGISIYFAE